jgi:hypothetical protein
MHPDVTQTPKLNNLIKHENPVVESLANASVQTIGAMNPLARAFLTGIHAAINPGREEKSFFNSLLNSFSASVDKATSYSQAVLNTPLEKFSELFTLSNPGSACEAIVKASREKVGVLNS